MLERVLATIPGAKRMIMGHTIQESGINGVCGNKAIRIDVGMSEGCINGLPESKDPNKQKLKHDLIIMCKIYTPDIRPCWKPMLLTQVFGMFNGGIDLWEELLMGSRFQTLSGFIKRMLKQV
ncbi:hypothetical protein Dimus_016537 [Dionaea muscipula]